MSKLPDLDTQDPGIVAFWNAIEQSTEDSINPTDVTSDSRVDSQTIYDNGVEGEYSLNTSTSSSVGYYRVKTDGWIITYVPTESDAVYGNSDSSARGLFDIIPLWADGTSVTTRDTLERAVNSLASELSNWSTIGNYYNTGDVGHYSFDYPDAKGVSWFGKNQGGDAGGTTTTVGLVPTPGTEVKHFSVSGAAYVGFNDESSVQFEGNNIASNSYTDSTSIYGARNLLSLLGGSLTPGTEYQGSVSVDNSNNQSSISPILVWE
jgi:hypothetical protein